MDNVTREAIRARLEEIAAGNGGLLTPEAVVSDARKKSSPLHNQFEWDVRKAAHEHWLDQARALIRTVRVVCENKFVGPAWVRSPVVERDEQGYVQTVSLRSDTDEARAVVVHEFSRAAAAIRRAREVAALLELQEVMDELLGQVETIRTRAQRPEDRAN